MPLYWLGIIPTSKVVRTKLGSLIGKPLQSRLNYWDQWDLSTDILSKQLSHHTAFGSRTPPGVNLSLSWHSEQKDWAELAQMRPNQQKYVLQACVFIPCDCSNSLRLTPKMWYSDTWSRCHLLHSNICHKSLKRFDVLLTTRQHMLLIK